MIAKIDWDHVRSVQSLVSRSALTASASTAIFYAVWIYGSSLRDPRYLDGWLLTAGMAAQVFFHIASKRLSLKARQRWRSAHIAIGCILIAAFLSHSHFSLPDTGIAWALWLGFVLITLSGLGGTYLSWSLAARRGIDDDAFSGDMSARRIEIAGNARAIIAALDGEARTEILPELPHGAWIRDLYGKNLRDFIEGDQVSAIPRIGSLQRLRRMTNEIDALSPYVDEPHQEVLRVLRSMVVEKDRLDRARLLVWMRSAWLFVHVPLTYGLIVLVTLHILIVYSFSSGSL
jgi:hypothetical protein